MTIPCSLASQLKAKLNVVLQLEMWVMLFQRELQKGIILVGIAHFSQRLVHGVGLMVDS